MSLNESPDCTIEAIIKSSATQVEAIVSTHLEQEQLQYFLRNRDDLTTDLHSTKARLGINQEKQGDFKVQASKISYRARFWFYLPEYAAMTGIDNLMKPGLQVGKIYCRNPKLKYTAEELINLICNRTIIVPKCTTVLEQGVLVLPVMPFVHRPNPRVLTPDYLTAAVQKKIPREDLYFVQPEQKVDSVVVPAGGGVITHTSLFTQQNEIYILDDEHTDARVGSRHTNGIIYLELVGGKRDLVKEKTRLEVYKPAYGLANSKKRFFIDQNAAFLETIYRQEEVNTGTIAVINNAVPESEGQQDTDLTAVKRNGRRLVELGDRYDHLLQDLKTDATLIMQDFPNRRLASYLIVAADMGLLKNLVFREAPEESLYFKSEHLAFMSTLQEMGVDIHWKSPLQGDLVLHKQFFMRSTVIPSFNEAFGSRKLAAIYGTAGAVDDETQKEIVDSVKSFKEFHGGICGILTGGSAGSIMSFVSETATSVGMLSGAVYWNIPGVDIHAQVDFAAYLARYDLLERQAILSESTEADIYFRGGVGTNLENAITFVKKKLGIGHYKPQIFVGDFYKPFKRWLIHLADEKMVDATIFESCYFIKTGAEVFETLCRHFGSEDKMIHEVSLDETCTL